MAGGDYGRVRHSFWTDPDIKRPLQPSQKLLLLYFFTNPHSNLIGLYSLPLIYAANETGLRLEDVREWTLGVLARWVTYDESTEEILVHKSAAHQVDTNLKETDNRVKKIVGIVNAAHSKPLASLFLWLYRHWPLGLNAPTEAPSKPLASPSEAIAVHSKAGHGTNSESKDSEPAAHESNEPNVTPIGIAQHRGKAAQIIRSVFWQGKHPPETAKDDWSMNNELSVWEQLAQQHGAETVNAALEVSRKALAGEMPDRPLTLLFFNVRGKRDRLSRCIAYHHKQQARNAPPLNNLGDMLRGLDATG